MTHILSQGPGRYRLCQAPGWQNADERWGAAVARSDKFSHHESTTLVRSFFVRICCCTFDTAASRMRPTNHVLNSINNPRPLPPINRGISSANYHSRPFPFSSSLLLCLLTTHYSRPGASTPPFTNNEYSSGGYSYSLLVLRLDHPFRTAVPFWRQTTSNWAGLPPSRGCRS